MSFSKEQITAGLELAQHWFEGWKFDEIQADQLLEAIEKADPRGYLNDDGNAQSELVSDVGDLATSGFMTRRT